MKEGKLRPLPAPLYVAPSPGSELASLADAMKHLDEQVTEVIQLTKPHDDTVEALTFSVDYAKGHDQTAIRCIRCGNSILLRRNPIVNWCGCEHEAIPTEEG